MDALVVAGLVITPSQKKGVYNSYSPEAFFIFRTVMIDRTTPEIPTIVKKKKLRKPTKDSDSPARPNPTLVPIQTRNARKLIRLEYFAKASCEFLRA